MNIDEHDKEEFRDPSLPELVLRSKVVVLIIILCILEIVECL